MRGSRSGMWMLRRVSAILAAVALYGAVLIQLAGYTAYRQCRAASRICACAICEEHYFGTERELWPATHVFRARYRDESYVRSAFLTFKQDPSGRWPVRGLLIGASAALGVGVAASAVWMLCVVRDCGSYILARLRRARAPDGVCAFCSYDLKGLSERPCPECGRPP